jgi:hypothetical protein
LGILNWVLHQIFMSSAASEDCNQRNENFQENFQEFIVAFYIWMGRINTMSLKIRKARLAQLNQNTRPKRTKEFLKIKQDYVA